MSQAIVMTEARKREHLHNLGIKPDPFLAAASGQFAISEYAQRGGVFDSRLADASYEDERIVGRTAAMVSILEHDWGQSFQAYLDAGGPVDETKDAEGIPLSIYAAREGLACIRSFAEAGGKFDSEPYGTKLDANGEEIPALKTAAVYAMENGADALEAFFKAGGEVSQNVDADGLTEAMHAAQEGPEVISVFAQNGGTFDNRKAFVYSPRFKKDMCLTTGQMAVEAYGEDAFRQAVTQQDKTLRFDAKTGMIEKRKLIKDSYEAAKLMLKHAVVRPVVETAAFMVKSAETGAAKGLWPGVVLGGINAMGGAIITTDPVTLLSLGGDFVSAGGPVVMTAALLFATAGGAFGLAKNLWTGVRRGRAAVRAHDYIPG